MDILLVKPYWPYPYTKSEYIYNRFWPPLCLANCASILEKNGFKVKILDCHALRIKPQQVKNHIKGFDKIFVTSSSLDKWQCPNTDIRTCLDTVLHIKELIPEVYMMGYHGTVDPERISRLTQAKAIIRGEPENSVLEICKTKELSQVKGISFFDAGQFISTSPNERLDLASLPLPAFHLLDFKKYYYEILGDRFSLFEISRGCPFNCTFCNKAMYGEGLRRKSKEQVFEEVSLAIEKYNVRSGYFIDLDFLSSREIVEALCDFLIKKKYGFIWTCQTRPDFLDAVILGKMKAAGCRIIHLGIETYTQELLNRVDKKTNIENIEKAIKLCRQAGIETFAFIMFGLPHETEEDRIHALRSIKNLNPDFVSFHKLVKFKGAPMEEKGAWPDPKIDDFIRKAFISYYVRFPRILKINVLLMPKCLKLLYGRIKTL